MKRTFSQNVDEQDDPIVGMVVDSLMSAQNQNKSFTAGLSSVGRDGYSVGQVAWELLSPSVGGQKMYTMVRASVVNITLWRTDMLPEPVKPFRAENKCSGSFMNLATGGKIYDTDCYSALTVTTPRFFGEVDTSATLIVSGLMGYGRANDSSEALNQHGYDWLLDKDGRLSDLILSRGMIVGLSPDFVTIEMYDIKPALSYLQLLLVFIALVLGVSGWCLMYRYKYYTSSLLAILLTTADQDHHHKKPGYMNAVPDIHLGENGKKTMMAVPEGAFVLDSRHQITPKRASQRGTGYQRAPAVDEEMKWANVKVAEGQVTPGGGEAPPSQFAQYTEYQGAGIAQFPLPSHQQPQRPQQWSSQIPQQIVQQSPLQAHPPVQHW